MNVEVEMKTLVSPDSSEAEDIGPAHTTDKMNFRVSKLLVFYVPKTTECFLGGPRSVGDIRRPTIHLYYIE